MLHQSRLMPQCIIICFFHWCSWHIRDMVTWLHSMQWGTWRVQLSMGSSMIRIKRLTCMVMLIWIGSATEKKSTLGCFFSLRSSMGYWFGRMQSCMALSTAKEKYIGTCLAICEVVCFFWKLLFDLIDLTCIFVWCEEEQWSSSMWSRLRYLERGSDDF